MEKQTPRMIIDYDTNMHGIFNFRIYIQHRGMHYITVHPSEKNSHRTNDYLDPKNIARFIKKGVFLEDEYRKYYGFKKYNILF